MADDLDDLLDAVETELSGYEEVLHLIHTPFRPKSISRPPMPLNTMRIPAPPSRDAPTIADGQVRATKPAMTMSPSLVEKIAITQRSETDDAMMDSILSDIPSTELPPPMMVAPTGPPEGQSGKCHILVLGGVKVPRGMCVSRDNERACDKLRCTACDFDVICFEGEEWSSKVNYLFLRNNYPDRERLLANLHKRRGYCAYACQCLWKSVSKPETIDFGSDYSRWVCGGH